MRLAPGDALLGGLLAASFAERASVGSDDPWTSGISVHDRPRTRAQLSLAAVQILPQSGAFTAQVAGLSDFGQTDCEERANTGGNRTQVVDAWNPDHPLPDRSLAQDADRLWSVPFPCHSAPEKRSANAPEAGPDRPAPGEQGMSGSAAAPPVDAGGRAESVPPDGATSLPSGPSAPILPPTAGRGMSGSVAFPPSGAGMGTPASSAPASLQANPLSQSNPLILSEPPGSGGTSGGSGSASPFVYFPDGPIGEQPPPVAPTPPDCNTVGMQPSPVVQPDANTGQGGAASTDAPVRDFDGLPLVTANDLSSNALGFPWGQTRSWTGLDNSSLNGNGWALSQLPYLVVGGGTNGQGSILYGTAADDRISVVEGGGQVFTFRVPASGPYASFVPWDAEKIRLDSIPGPTPVLRLTDSQGDVTDFYDVSRDATGRPLGHSLGVDLAQKFGRFKSYTPASGTSNVVASYDTAGYPTTVTRSDTVTGDTEQFVYAYATVTNDLVAAAGTTPPRLVASVTLQRPDANGNWQPVQRVQYTYYTGRLPNGVGGWVNDANGRLGDLELAQIENPVVTGDGSLTWQEINTDYYRYYKLTGESNGVPSQGPTNIAATTGGPAPLEPAGPYDPKAPSPFDDLVFSGLKTVVTGTAFDQLAAAVPNYQSASDAAIQPYVNNLFTYERWDDHIGTDGAYGSQPWDTTNIDINWRAGYRLGTRYRATEEMAQGAGCSLCAGGQGTYKYEYAANEDPTALGFNSIEYNTWRMKTTEFLPPTSPNWGDHNREVVYTDEVGQPLLDVFVQVGGPSLAVTGMTITASSATGATITVTAANHGFHTGDLVALSGVLPELYDGVFTVARIDANTFRFVLPSNYTTPVLAPTPSINQTIAGLTINSTVTKVTGQWATAYRYDGQGRLILKANPSAVSGYNDSQSDLLNSDSPGHFGYLYDHQGAIELTDYYATTTATEATPGGVAGYLKDREMEQGQLGTPILEESKQYFTHRVTDSTADVTVTTPAGTSVTSVADQFTYAPPPIPSVTGVGPNSGTDTGGSIVTLVGGTFTGVTGISFGETPAVSFVATDNVISVIAPPHAVGVVDITVTNRFGISATSAADRFTYWSSPPRDGGPVLTGLVPASGSAGGGDSVTLVGSNFSNAKAVYFGTTPAVSFSVLNDGVISARSPAHIAGAVDVTVITPSATSAVSAVGQFTYQPPAAPIITALSPSSGLSQGGTTVTLAGSHFTGATTVSFGGLATSFTILSDHVITARAPAHVAGSVDVTVTSLSGTSATSPADQFSYVATLPPPGPPKVIGLGPTSGSTAGGDTVVLVGSNFTGATAVAFGGTPAASFTLLSDSAIRAITPPQTVPTVYPVATDTVYRNTDGTGAETTSYEYTWLAGSTRMESQIITKPVVSASQNGPGVAGTQATIYDSAGRPIWQRDGDGFLTYTAYDPATSAVIEKITDVDTTRSGDFQNLPAGWATPPGGGLHLVTRYEVDAFGRTIAQTDPNGNTTYTVYDDAEHEVRTYAGWQASTGMPTGPTQVTRHDFAHSPSYTETLTMSAPPHLTNGRPDGTEPISGVVTLSRSFTSPGGQLIETDQYFSLAGVTYRTAPYLGIAGTNYYPTLLAYDQRGRLDRTISPTGTITRTLYDALGRVVSTWVGTNDSPASGYWSPDNNTAPANMIEVSAEVYDQGGVGDGNVTEAITFPGGGAAPRVTQNFYDWRDRLLASKQGVEDNEDDKTNRAIRYTTYDNLGEAVLVQQYEGDGVNLRMVDGVPQPPDAALLRGQTAVAYDDQGRVYQKMVFAVDPATGAVSSTALTTNSYYDQRGNRLAESDPGGLWTKNQYDGAGRLTIESRSDGGSGTRWIDAASVAGDIVLEQTETVYDGNNNVVETISRQRFDQTTGLGELGDPQSTAAPRARVYSTGSYYDAADRLTATVNVGTNGGTAWVRPSSVPARSDTVLVTSYTYTAAGWAQDAIDPRGLDTHTDYDTLGRPMEVIADYTGNAEAASSDVATLYSYDGDNHVLTMTAMQPAGTPSQTTAYVYGVTPA
ncbi:MAG TPA: IPT/TIG domain-containing protein, partial [Gemmataceae bacterium]|nr:IPT/TIG domain-containing protein [Gemmataceae bacterium]